MWAIPPEWFKWFAIVVGAELGLILVVAIVGVTAIFDIQKAVLAKADGQSDPARPILSDSAGTS